MDEQRPGGAASESVANFAADERKGLPGAPWTLAMARMRDATISGGQVILDLRVIWLSGVWNEVHWRYLASQPMPGTQGETVTGTQRGQQAA